MYKKLLYIFISLLLVVTLSGCNSIDRVKVKMGIRNTEFDFMKKNEVKQLVIESRRDKGYRFVVTNEDVIKDVREILASAKKVQNKSQLENDYILEIHERNGKIHKYKYIAGLDKKDGGNFYSEDGKEQFIVSSRLDNDILNNFENIRKPRKFKEVYYPSIIAGFKKFTTENKSDISGKTIGFNFNEDIEVQKFLLSLDIESFTETAAINYPMVKFVNDTSDCDYTLTVNTEGYTSIVYKAIIKVINNKTNKEDIYYVKSDYQDKEWKVNIFNKKPDGF